MSKRFYSISDYFKGISGGEKWVKLSVDGGFTCPNRDGKLGFGGCIFCSASGSGEFAGSPSGDSMADQVRFQKGLLSKKWPKARYIAYFQNFSNTYAPVAQLKRRYESALSIEGVSGLAIATRPDCVDDSVVHLLKSYNSLPVFWLELGFQSMHERSGKWMRRGYTTAEFKASYSKLKAAGIPLVVHLIAGIPGESKADFLESVAYISQLKPFGIKFHMLNVLKETQLGAHYLNQPFELLTRDQYTDWICDAIEHLDASIVIHRLTGDGPADLLLAPLWIRDKRRVLNGIESTLKARGTYQGCKVVELDAK